MVLVMFCCIGFMYVQGGSMHVRVPAVRFHLLDIKMCDVSFPHSPSGVFDTSYKSP